MYVYRIQNCKGQGPYSISSSDWEQRSHDYRSRCREGILDDAPAPQDDGLFINGKYKFGFISLSQMQSWFWPLELIRLRNYGFKPTRVKAKCIEYGGKQIMFIPA